MTFHHTEADARITIDGRLRQAGWDPLDKSMVGTEVQAADSSATNLIVDRSHARPFETHAPVYDLVAAAGAFGPDRMVGAAGDEIGWAPVSESVRLTRDHFVARVSGRSMEPTIPDGSHCLFRTDRGGSRQGKLVLVWQRGTADSALGGEFSVKKYESTKGASADSDWSHREIRLKPLNSDPSFRDLVFTPDAERNLHVIGEFVAVLDLPTQTATSGRADYVLYDQRGRPLAVISLPAGVFKPYAGVKTSVLVFRRPATGPAESRAATGRVWFYETRNDGYDPDKIQSGGRPETPEKNDIPGLMAAWNEYMASGYREQPGVEAGAVLDAGSDDLRCWWATFDAIADNDYNLTASRYKPRVAETVPDEDPAELIREVLAMEREIAAGLEKLLEEVE